ncbi:MAG: U32 family peptidase [Desulfobulbales bacterium]|nr:U32 family peptidase [Desulfobulbales bacterium]
MTQNASTYNTSDTGAASTVKVPELLAPAGSFEKMITAIQYGADAVYCGGKKFSLRAHAGNFSDKRLAEGVSYAHDKGVKVYVTVNIFAHNDDLQGLDRYLRFLRDIRVDGIIISDPGILSLARETIPGAAIHLSTQANVTNPENARFWESQGVSRLNLARELSLAEIAEIRAALKPRTLVEVFVHGALCISYSGRCLLSYYFTGRDANRGECAHPCRYKYVLQEEKRPGQYFPVEEDGRGTYIFNAKDLCLLNKLPQLVKIGVDSVKIEGRMKSVYYVGAVVRAYRAALDYIAAHAADSLTDNKSFLLPPRYMDELLKVGTRGYTENFMFGPPGAGEMLYDRPRTDQEYVPVGVVLDFGGTKKEKKWLEVDVRNPVRTGETVEYLGKGIDVVPVTIKELLDMDGIPVNRANPGSTVRIIYDADVDPGWLINGLLRKKK